MTKKCPRCGLTLEAKAFGLNRHSKDNLRPYCKPCTSAEQRERRAFWRSQVPPPQEPSTAPDLERRVLADPPTAPDLERRVLADPPPPAPPPLQVAQEAHREGRAQRDLRSEHRALLEENERLQAQLRALKPLQDSSPVRVPPAPAPERGEAVPLILASDWHVEEEVDAEKMHGINAYSLDIARERSRRFFVNSLRLVELAARDSVVRRCVVGLLGDLFSNSIHPELMEINQLGPQPAARFAKDLLAGGIRHWLDNSDLEWEFNCVGGNHGRMTEKTRIATNAENSLETFAYHFLAAEFKNEPRVKFRIAPGDMLYTDVFPQYRVRFIHGDQISYGGGVGGVTIPLNKWIARQDNSIRADLTCLGHFHQLADGGRFLLNGSLIGPSPYSQRFGFSPEKPAQQFALIHSRHGGCKSLVAPIWVDE